ncbi:MAG: FAD-dependent oxidoreductase, partial [Terriglobales bacterium]
GGQAANGAPSDLHRLEHALDSGRQFSVFSFEDAQCEFPERLVAQWLVEAVGAGCLARNHTQVLTVEVGLGKTTGLRLRDRLSGTEESVKAKWIINATGPWADHICQQSNIRTERPMVGGVRGSHIVLPKFAGAPEAAVYTEAVDGRPFFVIPWNGQLLVGTTEVGDTNDPGKVEPSAEEIEYLMRSVLELYPRAQVSATEIRYAFAGVRPLPYAPGSNLAGLSRRHFLHDHLADGAAGMISVIGGKLTTAASLARECVDKLGLAKLGEAASPQIAIADGSRVEELIERKTAELQEAGGIGRQSARGLVEWYGERSVLIAKMAQSRPELGEALCPHTNHIVAEAVHAISEEYAVTLGDVLLRRVPVALGPCWSAKCSRVASQRIAAAVGWDDRRAGLAREEFDAEREAFLRKPQDINAEKFGRAVAGRPR